MGLGKAVLEVSQEKSPPIIGESYTPYTLKVYVLPIIGEYKFTEKKIVQKTARRRLVSSGAPRGAHISVV